jgi:hypothetical protein
MFNLHGSNTLEIYFFNSLNTSYVYILQYLHINRSGCISIMAQLGALGCGRKLQLRNISVVHLVHSASGTYPNLYLLYNLLNNFVHSKQFFMYINLGNISLQTVVKSNCVPHIILFPSKIILHFHLNFP